MANRIRTLDFLPEIFQTPTNAEFLNATLDQLVNNPITKNIQGFVGSKIGYGVNAKDYYVTEPTKIRTDYQLDPGVVFTKNNTGIAQDFISYPGIIDSLKIQGGITDNNNRLFESQFYSWDSFANLDPLINYDQYYWLPNGPPAVTVSNATVPNTADYYITSLTNEYQISTNSAGGGSLNPQLRLLRGGQYRFHVKQDSDFWIQGLPGVSGYSPTQSNLYVRDVYGVNNNGTNDGIVTFNVPQKNAQDEYNLPGNNTVGVISRYPFSQINGQLLSSIGGIDSVNALNGLRVLFYDTGVPNETGYVSSYWEESPWDTNNPIFDPYISTTQLNIASTTYVSPTDNYLTLDTGYNTSDLYVNQTLVFSNPVAGNIVAGQVYFITEILNSTDFRISKTLGGTQVVLTNSSTIMTATIGDGLYEEGFYTTVNDNYYKVTYVGDPNDPVLRLIPDGLIPTSQKITAEFGTNYSGLSFFKNTLGYIQEIPYITAPLDILYYQDGTSSTKVGVIRIIENNVINTLDVETDILGKKNFTSTNGVVFTNGLKVIFSGDVIPTSYLTGEYYVQGVGTAIELIPVASLVCPEKFSIGEYNPYDISPYDTKNYDINLYIPVQPDYVTISRDAINKNPWTRSNRWFHEQVIQASATYNNDPTILTAYANSNTKANRPIIEFYSNLKLFNSGTYGKRPVDFIDTRCTDALSIIENTEQYYPDVQVYTGYDATIASNPNTSVAATSIEFVVGDSYLITTVGTTNWNHIVGTTNLIYVENQVIVAAVNEYGDGTGFAIPLSTGTTITVPASSVTGAFVVGMFVGDSTAILPTATQITNISVGTEDITLTVSWANPQNIITGTTVASIVGTDTSIDNYALFSGARIIFAADTDITSRNKIYVANFSQLTAGSNPVITLSVADDGDCLPDDQTVIIRGYANQGNSYYYDGLEWILGQKKLTVNQNPLFDIFDSNSISLGNRDVYVGTSFKGCTLFQYGIGTGSNDPVLGFPLKYSSLYDIGDIVFEVTLNSQIFTYTKADEPITQQVNTGYVYNYVTRTDYLRLLGWQTAVAPSTQYQIFQFTYDIANPTVVSFTCDVAILPAIKYDEKGWPRVQVYYNNVYQNTDMYTVTTTDNTTTITLTNANFIVNTPIQILVLSNQVSTTAYYSIPINLSNNPFNEDVTSVNVGDVRNQYLDMFINAPNTSGDIFGSNNFRDCGNLVDYGTKIIQNSAALVLPGMFLRNPEFNIFGALMFNSREYTQYKQLIVNTVENTDYTQRYTPSQVLDSALDQITASKSQDNSFFWSDMLPNKSAYITNVYSFNSDLDQTIYPLSHIYNFESANYDGLLVYLYRAVQGVVIEKLLLKNIDYIVSSTTPSLRVIKPLIAGDKIIIKEYNKTYGSYVPNTPTKLGLYPLFVPQVVTDNDYSQPTSFIVGHDGSYTKLYGYYDTTFDICVDYRDQALLEFERRIYDNIKLSTEVPISKSEIVPGFFRDGTYSYEEFLEIYSTTFLDWVGANRIDYKTQFYNRNNSYTYNYTSSANKLNNTPILQGYWRGVYEYFYDTSTPNLTPWEMLGFSIEPDWWTAKYGPAPYTSNNGVLWADLEKGNIYNNGADYINTQYARPGLTTILPVDGNGDLISPFYSVMGNFNPNGFQKDWKVGDDGPAEFSYRRSSTFPYDLMRIYALTEPAKFYNLGVDLDVYKYNKEFNQFLVNDRSHLKLSDIEVYGNGTPVTSYINWVVDYQKQQGIDATADITSQLQNLDVRLVYRLAGYSDQNMLSFYVEKGSPNSTNASLLIPNESYNVLLYDNQPYDKIQYSAVIVQKVIDGYTVYGNSQNFAYFTIQQPATNTPLATISIDSLSVKYAKNYSDKTALVPYGTKFYSVQEVAQFLISYGRYLESQGMLFNQVQNGVEVTWEQMVSELLYWVQTGWEIGSVITLNPSAVNLNIDKPSAIVQPLTVQQNNFILNQNLYPISLKDLCVERNETLFHVHTLNQGDSMSYAQFNVSNFEHGIVFNNVTLFNDVIYTLVTGLKQNRIYLRGIKTAEWNGTINAYGFIYNQDNIKEWSNQSKYTKGEIVLFKNKYYSALKIIEPSATFQEQYWKKTSYNEIQKGLLPNSATQSYESTLYYDTDRANIDKDANLLSYSLIGYRPRDYLAIADLTETTQINVYKNFIKNKGTRNAVEAFKGLNLPQGEIDYQVYENWAIKQSEYGGVLNQNFVEFKLDQPQLTGNPSIVSLTTGIYTPGSMQEVTLYNLFNYGTNINNPNILSTTTYNPPIGLYPDAGYVNFNDVKMASYFYSNLPTATNNNNNIVPIQNFYVRDYVWMANFKERWNVFVWKPIGQVIRVRSNPNNTSTITFNTNHGLKKLDPVSIVNFAASVDGYYIVVDVVNDRELIINLIVSNSTQSTLQGQGIGLTFTSQRVNKPSDISTLDLIQAEFVKNTVWVDENTDGNWAVYRKSINYQYYNKLTENNAQTFGSSVAYTDRLGFLYGDSAAGVVYRYTYDALFATYLNTETLTSGTSYGSKIVYGNNVYVISEPTDSSLVHLYTLNDSQLDSNLLEYQTISAPMGVTNWGSSVALSKDANWLYISDVDNNLVYVYRRQNILLTAGYFTATKTYTITTLGDTDFTLIGAIENKIGITFVATGAGLGSGTATQINYELANTIDGSSQGLSAGDNFSTSITTTSNGEIVVIGAPYVDYSMSIQNWGKAYAYQRTVQNLTATFNSTVGNSQSFVLAWQPNNIAGTTGTIVNSNYISVVSTTGMEADMPIMFVGTNSNSNDFKNTGINPYIVYYIADIIGNTFSIKTSRSTSTPLTLVDNTGLAFTAYAQSNPLNVRINGSLVQDNNYATYGYTFVYAGTLLAGDILNVGDSQFYLLQEFNSDYTNRTNIQFSTGLDITSTGSNILIGSPFEVDADNQEGAAYSYTNPGASYGVVVATYPCNLLSTATVLINGYLVNLTPGNAQHIANLINQNRINNVQASYTNDNRLIVQVIDQNLSFVNNQLTITAYDTSTLGALGVVPYTNTQIIKAPHKEGPSQFGANIKINEFNSVVISALSGTRYEGTTFDFVDDENGNDDTIFDNNATRFVDSFPNAGAVYMYDYLSNYNENINNAGKYVYAQSVNSQDLIYGDQPYYGTALDFNDYKVVVGTPNFMPGDVGGQVTIYNNPEKIEDWSVYRSSCPIVDINKIQNTQLFEASTNNTLINLDYFDPLQDKLLGAVRENLDYITNIDPAKYNSDFATLTGNIWSSEHVGQLWFNTHNVRWINYHQNDVVYNSTYWGSIFPGSDVAVYTWVSSFVPPNSYRGLGTVYDTNLYSVTSTLNSSGVVIPVYYFWVRNSNIIATNLDKTLSDNIVASYISNPKNSGIAYMAPLLPNTFALYNSTQYFNANNTVFHIGFSNGLGDNPVHQQFALIRENYPDDFLPGLPNNSLQIRNAASRGIQTTSAPSGLYTRLLNSLSGCDDSGAIVPDPFLPKAVQSGILARPNQSFFYDRFVAVKNFLEYANVILAQYPITEIRPDATFLFASGIYYNTADYWQYINWWAVGYNNSTRTSLQVPIYADLANLTVNVGTLVTVEQNGAGKFEVYRYDGTGVWTRIGLQNGTISFKSTLWDYSLAKLGFGGDFFDNIPFDTYPSEETRYIVRALCEQIYINELVIHRNKSLILLFDYIQSETVESQNYLPWLNKTSLIDVSHKIRDLIPIQVYKSDNETFLEGYINETKPYHVVIKDFLFTYPGIDTYDGNITDFDLPAVYNSSYNTYISPQLVYNLPSSEYQYNQNDSIWQTSNYNEWYKNHGVSLTGQTDYQITILKSYVTLGSKFMIVDNAQGFPINGIVKIGDELIGYSYVDRASNLLGNLQRGVENTTVSNHIPGELLYIDLPPVLLLDGGVGYTDPPMVKAVIDTSIYPEPTEPAVFEVVMGTGSVLQINTINPGKGYAVLPEIQIDPAQVIYFNNTYINSTLHTIRLYAPNLITGALVRYKNSIENTNVGELHNNQWYYVNVLENIPTAIVALYASYGDAVKDQDRIKIYDNGTGTNFSLNEGARASAITTSYPVRENNITLRYDRTSYTPQVVDWVASSFYGSYFAGTYHDSNRIASSSIQLESVTPPIGDILASAQGVTFEIVDVNNDQVIDWSGFERVVQSTTNAGPSFANDLRYYITLQYDSTQPNASGSTIGMVTGMPVKFAGATVGGIVVGQVYYVATVINESDFSISTTPDGLNIVTLSTATAPAAGLNAYAATVTNTAILTVNYPGIEQVTATTSITNTLTVPVSAIGTGGTNGFYTNISIFFTGNVFGNIVENTVYYVTTVIDDQTFTISKETNPLTVTVTESSAISKYITVDTVDGLSLNDPIIFNNMQVAGVLTDTFGNIIAGTQYYVKQIIDTTHITISSIINAPIFDPGTVVAASDTSASLVSQANCVQLVDATGSMTMNVNLPVSPGQVNGQLFTLYKTSVQYPNITSVTIDALITRDINATIATVDRIAFDASTGTSNFYVNMPIRVDSSVGGLIAGTTYYVTEYSGEIITDPFNPAETIPRPNIEVTVTSTSSTGNSIKCDNTTSLYSGMKIIFSGQNLGNIIVGDLYYVLTIIDGTHFTISSDSVSATYVSGAISPSTTLVVDDTTGITSGMRIVGTGFTSGQTVVSVTNDTTLVISATTDSTPSGILTFGNEVVISNSTGIMVGTGDSYIKVSTTMGGSSVVLSTDITGTDKFTQYITAMPTFDISYLMGGYSCVISNGGTGFAINNTVTILGTLLGGTTTANDLVMTVNTVDSDGTITSVICSGTPIGIVEKYYLKVIGTNLLAVYSNPLMTVPVSGLTFLYDGFTSTTVTQTQEGPPSYIIVNDASEFYVNDKVIFTGDVAGGIEANTPYYIKIISTNNIRLSTEPGGTDVLLTIDTDTNFTMAKVGSYAVLPEPFYFNQSIVKYNNRVYQCVISNNDTTFIFGKWQLLESSDIRLNALDRVIGYYQPTSNMPGVDITQLFEGVTYPNSIYQGNSFQPYSQYPIDTYLQDQPFYPTNIDITGVVNNGTKYVAVANLPTNSSLLVSDTTSSWDIGKLTNTPVDITQLSYNNSTYLAVSTNVATPIFKSLNGVSWTVSGYVIPYGRTINDKVTLNSNLLSLNSSTYNNSTYVVVGNKILTSTDATIWTTVTDFEDVLQYNLYNVATVSATGFTGFITVGSGLRRSYSTGVTTLDPTQLILFSSNTNGINWQNVTSFTDKALYGVTSNGTNIVTVGEKGVIYYSNNANDWFGVNEIAVISVNSSTKQLNINNTATLNANDTVKFSKSFSSITAGVTYYIITVDSSTQVTLSATSGGSTLNLTAGVIPEQTQLYTYNVSDPALRDIVFANAVYVAVGDTGTIKTSTDNLSWTTVASGTIQNLNKVIYNDSTSTFVIVGDSNTVLTSIDNGVTWIDNALFNIAPANYTVKGAAFEYGYGPEELVAGVVTDNLQLTVNTRPGTTWPTTTYSHAGYNVVSKIYTPDNSTQTVYSFADQIQYVAQLTVQIIDPTTNLGTTLNRDIYTVDWINQTITLDVPLAYTPQIEKLRVDLYEAGNGNQLVKSNTFVDPIRTDTVSGFNEIYLNCNYSAPVYQGSGVVRMESQLITTTATETDGITNRITVDSVKNFVLNSPITFQGAVFGNISESITYYVKTISSPTNTISVSAIYDPISSQAGPTFILSTDSGSMSVDIQAGNGAVYSQPLMYHNGEQLQVGNTGIVLRTLSSNNSLITNTTSGLIVGNSITFCDCVWGTIVPYTTYYIVNIIDSISFQISESLGGPVFTLADGAGGTRFITNDFAFGIQPNGIQAKIMFASDSYNVDTDYFVYSVYGETDPVQYGFSIPEIQQFIGDGATTEFALLYANDGDNAYNAIVEINGLRLTITDYVIDQNFNTITFDTAPALNDVISVTTYNDTEQQYLVTQYGITGKTVSAISNINNAITAPLAVTQATNITSNVITCSSTDGFAVTQPVIFQGTAISAVPKTDGTVYFIKTIPTSTTFTISATPGGPVLALTNGSGAMLVTVGGNPTVTITTATANGLSTNDVVRIDGVVGSVQLNNQTFYARKITDTQFGLYTKPYSATLGAPVYPVTSVSSYVSGGYVWENDTYYIITADCTTTGSDEWIDASTLAQVNRLVPSTPIYFAMSGYFDGDTLPSGFVVGTQYYVVDVDNNGLKFAVSATRDGTAIIPTASTAFYATQWLATNVDRLYVTVNGYRVTSNNLRLNNNQVSILADIQSGDEVIITSMINYSTPNIEIYFNFVDKDGVPAVYRSPAQSRTWLTQPIYELSTEIFVNDVASVTSTLSQTSTVPAVVNGYYYIGINGDKNTIVSVSVYNSTLSTTVDSTNYSIVIIDQAPVLKITAGAYIAAGNSLSISILEGNIVVINGEQIRFSSVNFTNNSLGTLVRGINGTSIHNLHEVYSEVYSLLSKNKLATAYYATTWNSYEFNPIDGDPLQISQTITAAFLQVDIL